MTAIYVYKCALSVGSGYPKTLFFFILPKLLTTPQNIDPTHTQTNTVDATADDESTTEHCNV